MKFLLKSITLLGVLAMTTSTVVAQSNTEIIKFPHEVEKKFTLKAEDGITYQIQLKKNDKLDFQAGGMYTDGSEGQGLTIALRQKKDTAETTVHVEAAPGEPVQFNAPTDGTYEIVVMNPGTKKAKIFCNIVLNGRSE